MILVTIVHGGYKPTYNKKTLSEVLCEDSGVDLFGFQCSWFPVSISAVFRSGRSLSHALYKHLREHTISTRQKKNAQHCLILPKNAKYQGYKGPLVNLMK